MVGVINGLIEASGDVMLAKLSYPIQVFIKKEATKALGNALLRDTNLLAALGKTGVAYVGSNGTEVCTEVMQELVGIFADEFAKRHTGDTSSLNVKEAIEQITEVAIATFKASSLLALGGGAIRGAHSVNSWRQAQATYQYYEKLTQCAEKSGVLDVAPGVLESAVQSISENNGVPSLFIDGSELNDKLNQSDVSVQEFAEKIGANTAEVQQAIAEGQDVAIPVGKYAVALARTELHKALMPHIRETRDGLSLYDLQQAGTLTQEYVDALRESPEQAQSVIQRIDGDNGLGQARRELQAEFEEKLKLLPNYTPEQASLEAKVGSIMVATMAQMRGVKPEELKSFAPAVEIFQNIEAQQQEANQRAINQLMTGEIPPIAEPVELTPVVVAKDTDGRERRVMGINGSPDLTVLPEVPGVKPLPVRLQEETLNGEHFTKHEADVKAASYQSVTHAIVDIAQNYQQIYKGAKDGQLLLVRPIELESGRRGVLGIQFQEVAGIYRVGTVFASSADRYLKNRALLLDKSHTNRLQGENTSRTRGLTGQEENSSSVATSILTDNRAVHQPQPPRRVSSILLRHLENEKRAQEAEGVNGEFAQKDLMGASRYTVADASKKTQKWLNFEPKIDPKTGTFYGTHPQVNNEEDLMQLAMKDAGKLYQLNAS